MVFFSAMVLNAQKNQNLSLYPPMGWNSREAFGCDVNEKRIMQMADAMIVNDLVEVGYEYIVVNDCWHIGRDDSGQLIEDSLRFPSGIKALTDYVHAKGLKFGLRLVADQLENLNYTIMDAELFAQWDVDYLMFDCRDIDEQVAKKLCTQMRDELFRVGNQVLLSICTDNKDKPENKEFIGQVWKASYNIYDCFDCEMIQDENVAFGVLQAIDNQENLRDSIRTNYWIDLGILEVGNRGLTISESRTQFSIWSMLASPLFASTNMLSISNMDKETLTNLGALSINQDPLGIQAKKMDLIDGIETWVKPLVDDEWAICFFNRTKVEKEVVLNWKNHMISDRMLNVKKEKYLVYNVWTYEIESTTKKVFKGKIDPHDVILLRLIKK